MHRIGRTGRAGASGEAISLVSADETTYLRDIEKLLGFKIETEVVKGFEPDPNASSKPEKRQQSSRKNFPRNNARSRNSSGNNSKRRQANNRRN